MKQTLLILFLSISFIPAFSQYDSLLKTFKFRNSNYRALNFSVGGGSQYERVELASGTNKNYNAGGGFGGNYFAAKSTDRILFTGSAGLSTSFNTGKSDNGNVTDKQRNFGLAPQLNVLNKWFNRNYFTELGVTTRGFLYGSKSDNISTPTGITKNNQSEYSVAINTGIGKGRLENVTDMQNALWLSKALQQVNSLSHALNAMELNALGRTITKANNTRVLDSRKRTQFVLETVDNYFQQNGLINKTDIRYFSNLNDILFFAYNTPRLSGTEKFVRFTPAIAGYDNEYIQNNNITKQKNISTVQSLTLSTGFSKYTPVNLVHQNNFGASLKFAYTHIDFADRIYNSGILTSEAKGIPELKQGSLNVFFEHAIYPSTRTIINFNLQAEAGYQEVNNNSNLFGGGNIAASWDYFISYRTKLQATVGGYYRKNVYQVTRYLEFLPNNFSLYANAGIIVSI